MSRFTQPILFDESIGEWRFRTRADDEYAKKVTENAFPEQKNGKSLKDLLNELGGF